MFKLSDEQRQVIAANIAYSEEVHERMEKVMPSSQHWHNRTAGEG
jgi:hypothetical protein